MNKFIVSLSLLLCVGVFQSSFGQDRTDVRIENDVFSVSYNETLEQLLRIIVGISLLFLIFS